MQCNIYAYVRSFGQNVIRTVKWHKENSLKGLIKLFTLKNVYKIFQNSESFFKAFPMFTKKIFQVSSTSVKVFQNFFKLFSIFFKTPSKYF